MWAEANPRRTMEFKFILKRLFIEQVINIVHYLLN
jgi:hypothetical protein